MKKHHILLGVLFLNFILFSCTKPTVADEGYQTEACCGNGGDIPPPPPPPPGGDN